jgi:hypothetical protein
LARRSKKFQVLIAAPGHDRQQRNDNSAIEEPPPEGGFVNVIGVTKLSRIPAGRTLTYRVA